MYDDWHLTLPHSDILIRAGDISAAIRAAEDAEWDIEDGISMSEPFDPFADDPE